MKKKYISVKSSKNSKVKFFSTYDDAMKNAGFGDIVTVHADPGGQVFITDGIKLK